MSSARAELIRSIRAARHYNAGDALADAEIAACRAELQRKNGSNGSQPESPRYCFCRELIVGGERQPMPKHHDCGYVAARAALVDEAEARAIKAVGYPDKNNGSAFTRRFNLEMDRLSRPLLHQSSSNGAHAH
jgi:hypothetical protein